MDDIKTLIIGVIGGLLVLLISKAINSYRLKSLKDDINFLELEKRHLEEMKRSSIEMNRSAFRSIFSLLFFIGLANFIPRVLLLINAPAFNVIADYLTALIWGLFVFLSLKFWQRYDNLKNYKAAINKIEEKLEKLNNKIKN